MYTDRVAFRKIAEWGYLVKMEIGWGEGWWVKVESCVCYSVCRISRQGHLGFKGRPMPRPPPICNPDIHVQKYVNTCIPVTWTS